ncbi:MAG: DEAD/DEAH box helicase family protein [Alphaproteobacteria bacterium]|nr:DEAD/DEAH box helicase family protein [Alphaproteobacteria bacterium]
MAKKAGSKDILRYLQASVAALLSRGHFENGKEFRPTQREALEAYAKYLKRSDLTDAEKLKGFFEIPTGVGKTAVFVAIIAGAHDAAKKEGVELSTKIVVPTIDLMQQTDEAIQEFAKSYAGHIGHYGDGHKNLKKPITIMTYDAWADLTEKGIISADNTDILISDEAHRGTSDVRVDLFEEFNCARAARLAFTATARFDVEKSVHQTHERQIYYKSLSDAVRGDESAEYIQIQLRIIRVTPPKKKKGEFADAANNNDVNKFALRKAAWNKRAVVLFAEGTDRRTGDPLSDNQAGFFTFDTTQADDLAQKLNANTMLAHKAAARGCKGVAVSIHSNMPRKEQKQRMNDYKAGKYMAVVGDEKFKEGFDHPPMKTIVDCPHGSLPDKAQIMGRGARKWWNPVKQRWEGLTFIDTIVYVGSDDPEEDERLRAEALRRAVLAADIIDDVYVLKGKPKGYRDEDDPDTLEPPCPKGGTTVIDGQEVEEITEPAQIRELLNERMRLRRDHMIEITSEMRKQLEDHMRRTGVGSKALVKVPDAPEGLTAGMIDSWRNGTSTTADPVHWNWVMARYESLPDETPTITITPTMRKQLEDHARRTGVGSTALVKVPDVPKGLTVHMIYSWRNGTVTTADPVHWNWVMARYESLPDETPTITITPAMRKQLEDHVRRTGVGSKTLLQAKDVPEGLTANMIDRWRNGTVTTADPVRWNWVMARYESLPDKGQKPKYGGGGSGLTPEF